MTAIKSYTDLEQSKKLATILPIESADMFHFIHEVDTVGFGYKKDAAEFYSKTEFEYLPCWSLAALLGVSLKHIGDSILRMNMSGNDFNLWLDDLSDTLDENLPDITKDNPVDACYEMVLKLHELKML